MTNAILRGKPDAGNPHVRFDEGEVASAKPRRGSLLYKKPLIALSIVCASALPLADIEQWQSNWFAGIGTGVSSISDLKPKNGSWSALTEGTAEITTDGALELDLDSGTEATFTVTEGKAEDTETLQRLTVTGVFTPIAADELLRGSNMADKNAQVGFAVVSETAEFCYKCTDLYAPGDEGGIPFDDPDIGVQWPVLNCPYQLSEKDRRHTPFAQQTFDYFERW